MERKANTGSAEEALQHVARALREGNDARRMREWYADGRSLADLVRRQCERLRGEQSA